jgi:hypothetical protein
MIHLFSGLRTLMLLHCTVVLPIIITFAAINLLNMKINKNYYLYVLLSLFLFSFTDGTKIRSEWEKDGLKGKVKSVHVFTYKIADQKTLALDPLTILKKDTSNHLIISYDEDGILTQRAMSKGKKLLTRQYLHSSAMIISTRFDADEKIIGEDTSLLNEDGFIIQDMMHTFGKDTSYYRVDYNVDANGKVLEADASTNNKFTYKWMYQYDSIGNKIQDDQFMEYSVMGQRWVYKYDENRNKIEVALYMDTLVEKYVYKYDNHGSMTEESHYGSDEKLIDATTYKYDYDDKGNWIRCLVTSKKPLDKVTIRAFEYYQ